MHAWARALLPISGAFLHHPPSIGAVFTHEPLLSLLPQLLAVVVRPHEEMPERAGASAAEGGFGFALVPPRLPFVMGSVVFGSVL